MTETNLSQIAKQIEIELEPSGPVITKEYHYKNKNGKDVKVVRTYIIKHDKTYKIKNNREPITKYAEEHKDKYLNLPRHKQVSALINDVKKDLELNVSRTGAKNVLEEVIGRKQMTIEEVKQKAEEKRIAKQQAQENKRKVKSKNE